MRTQNVAARDSFAVWFADQMKREGLTQYRAASIVGVSQRCISKWRAGESRPAAPEEYVRIAACFGISVYRVIEAAAGGAEATDDLYTDTINRRDTQLLQINAGKAR